MHKHYAKKRRGFTLVEVLIVVVILGILAATVVPQITTASDEARESAVIQDLQSLRSQIELYKFQHDGTYPANGSTTEQDFMDAMLLSSDVTGTTGAPGSLPYGPYFIGDIPPNPYNGLRTLTIVQGGTLPAADDATGWIYNSDTGQIKLNATGTTDSEPQQPLEDL